MKTNNTIIYAITKKRLVHVFLLRPVHCHFGLLPVQIQTNHLL
ncbi:hypothetical protein [Bacillus sp. 28A-2]|nr:hypothetical protein [Bacillus sp. 28A-2]